MSISYQDVAYEMALENLQNEAVMSEAKLAQCIYLFVEGLSEEKAFPVLLKKASLDMEDLGVVLANYNGNGNLIHSLRLLRNTLSHTRPIVVTIDNDDLGARVISKCQELFGNTELVQVFPIPSKGKVKYHKGHVGGSFEELFSVSHFLDNCFTKEIMNEKLLARKTEFIKTFDKKRPWYSQVKAFCAKYKDYSFESRKAKLAELLAKMCDSVPKSITELASVIKALRNRYPVKHPLDVELPM